MKSLSYFFFYTYIGLVLVAGFWGAFVNPYFDFKLLFSLEPHTLDEYSRVNLMGQYRFLRALELGFGLFAMLFVKNIFTEKTFNTLFLVIMAAGVLARSVSWMVDGTPGILSRLFLFYELLGVVIIFLYTKRNVA